MGAEKTRVLNYLEMRYDFVSARNVLNNWMKTADVKDADYLDDNALKSLLEYLKDNAADAARVHAAIERLILGGDDAPAAVDAPVDTADNGGDNADNGGDNADNGGDNADNGDNGDANADNGGDNADNGDNGDA